MEKPYVKNSSDEEQIRDAERKVKNRRDREINDLSVVLSDPHGRRFIWRILSECGVFQTSFSPDSNQMYFNEGERNVGLKIFSEVNEVSPEAYLKMMKENENG